MAAALSMVPSVVVSAFAQSQIEGRCVLVFGSAMGSVWEKALERGARLVHVCDPNPERLAEAAAKNTLQSVSFAPLSSQTTLAVRDGAFDIGIIDNLSAMSDLPMLVRRLKRALSPRGLAFITAPNPDVQDALVSPADTTKQVLDYYTLYDIVRTEFPIVRMLGQMPFVGYTVAELAPVAEPEPKLDAGFVMGGTEEPEWFVAAASAQPFELDGFTVVQLPMADVLHNNATRQLREQLRSSRHAERSAVERLARLEAQLSQVQQRHTEQRMSAELSRQLEELKEELRRKERWIASVEARATAADSRADDADLQVERLQQDAVHSEHLEVRVIQLENELGELKAQLVASEQQVNKANADLNELGELKAQLVTSEQQVSEANADLNRLEVLLQERGGRIRQLEAELQSVTRVGEQLVRQLQNSALEVTRATESQSWSDNVSAASATILPTDTAQSPERTSAWVSHLAHAPSVQSSEHADDALRSLLDERARLRADVQAAAWRVEQLAAATQQSRDVERQFAELKNQFALAQGRLNEQEVLLQQLRSHTTC
jgi:hypothetical protein